MSTYILTWNHTKWDRENFEDALRSAQSGRASKYSWSTGNSRQLQPGDSFFLLRRHDHQGITGSEIVSHSRSSDHLGLTMKYEYVGVDHDYEPVFIVRLTSGLNVILEIKGYEVHNSERVNSKHEAAKKWVRAVNNLGDFGKWEFLVCRELNDLIPCLSRMVESLVSYLPARQQFTSIA